MAVRDFIPPIVFHKVMDGPSLLCKSGEVWQLGQKASGMGSGTTFQRLPLLLTAPTVSKKSHKGCLLQFYSVFEKEDSV